MFRLFEMSVFADMCYGRKFVHVELVSAATTGVRDMMSPGAKSHVGMFCSLHAPGQFSDHFAPCNIK